MNGLSRRQVVHSAGAVGLGLLAGCGRLPGQFGAARPQESQVTRIGFLSAANPAIAPELRDAFRQGLADYGQLEGRDIAIEWRSAEGFRDRLPGLLADLLRLGVAVIVVPSPGDAHVVRQATSSVPIVVAGLGGDLVEWGLAASFAHPGGQVTGLSIPFELEGKRLQLLMEAAPGLSKVALVRDASSSLGVPLTDFQGFGHRLGVQILSLPVGSPEELDGALAAAAHADGLWVPATPLIGAHRAKITAFAAEHRLPAVYGRRWFVEDGGLMSYEPRFTDLYRRAAHYVDRILRGAKPADLPIEQPMVFDFVINLRTAQALGLTIPPHVLAQATEVIQ